MKILVSKWDDKVSCRCKLLLCDGIRVGGTKVWVKNGAPENKV